MHQFREFNLQAICLFRFLLDHLKSVGQLKVPWCMFGHVSFSYIKEFLRKGFYMNSCIYSICLNGYKA